jgi:hypothetical protein
MHVARIDEMRKSCKVVVGQSNEKRPPEESDSRQ